MEENITCEGREISGKTWEDVQVSPLNIPVSTECVGLTLSDSIFSVSLL